MTIQYRFAAPQMVAAVVDELVVNVNGPDPITDATWDPYVAWMQNVPVLPPFALTFSPAQGPNSAQRSRLLQAIQRRDIPQARVAIVTSSEIVRAAIVALGWFMKLHNKPFKPTDVDGAMSWLAQSCRFDRREVRSLLYDAIVEVGFTPAQRQTWLG